MAMGPLFDRRPGKFFVVYLLSQISADPTPQNQAAD